MRDYHLSIAGIHFRVLSDPSLPVPSDGPYRAFVSVEAPPDGWVTCEVVLTLGDVEDVKEEQEIFRSGLAWRLYRHADGARVVTHADRDGARLQWRANITADGSHVALTCRGDLARHPLTYPLDQVLTTLLLPRSPGLLLHAAAIVLNGRAFVLAGKSGAGKSTIARLLLGGGEGLLLSDDRVIARKTEGGWLACGTPWPGEGGMALNEVYPLAGLLFLEKAAEHRLTPLSARQGLPRLLPVASVPWYDEVLMSSSLVACEALLESTPVYTLDFAPDRSVAEFLEKAVG